MKSPTEQQLGEAFRDLVAEQPFTPDVSAIEDRARQARRRDRIVRGGIGAGVVAVVAVAVAAIGIANTVPSAPAGKALASGAHRASTRATPSASAGTQPPLVKLVADLAAEPRSTGDATLVERDTTLKGMAGITVWDLYADDGRYFFSRSEAGLPAQVKEDHTQGGGMFKREVEAATYALTGNLKTAALKMAWPQASPIPANLSKDGKTLAAGTEVVNFAWEDCQDALVAGAGNPKVRAGVLRLVSALPGITVTHGTADGQPTLTLTAGAAELGGAGGAGGPNYQEAITINAQTGIPLKFVGGPAGGPPDTTVTWKLTRVNLADVGAGKF